MRYDPAQYKQDQKRSWDELAEGWIRWESVFERGAGQATQRLLELGGVGPGQSVLDIATGLGEPAISAARVTGPRGRVIGIDQAANMLEAARQRSAGLPNLQFQAVDAETLDFPAASFDVVLSRWGLMFLPDIEGTLRRIQRMLKPGGRLAATVWGPPPKVPMIGLAFSVIARTLQLPPPPEGLPNPFILADTAKLEGLLEKAGFQEISLTRMVVPFTLASAQEFVEFSRDLLPARMKRLLEDAGASVQRDIWEQVAKAADERRLADGRVSLESEAICIRAVA
jgi:ubiquinone/menaquinone biosynthesis C-methylase UbiE